MKGTRKVNDDYFSLLLMQFQNNQALGMDDRIPQAFTSAYMYESD